MEGFRETDHAFTLSSRSQHTDFLPLTSRSQVFKYSHYLFIPAGVLVILHVPDSWPYVVLPATIFALDWLCRWHR
jgi:hypothetical protein